MHLTFVTQRIVRKNQFVWVPNNFSHSATIITYIKQRKKWSCVYYIYGLDSIYRSSKELPEADVTVDDGRGTSGGLASVVGERADWLRWMVGGDLATPTATHISKNTQITHVYIHQVPFHLFRHTQACGCRVRIGSFGQRHGFIR